MPPNSVRLILDDWRELLNREVEIALYARFKKYFEYLNTGFKGKRYDVFAYNGGLFKTDELLDGLKIDDELLYRHTLKLSEYDFASEVDVNILGHIFENSLNELDEIKAQLEGQQVDKSKSKRKKDGVFYTPKYITKYIVDNTVGKLCTEKKVEIGLIEKEYITDQKRTNKTKQPLFEKLTAYRNWLLQLTICDPACGSGAFLNQALDFLINEHRYIDELQAKLFGDAMVLSDFEKNILENNLFGVDLNEESVEIAKLSLWLRTAQPNRKLNDLNNNIKCGNSLIDDPAVAGDKAFNWQEEFPSVFAKGGFDVVIGNPPYVRAELLGEYRNHFYQQYKVFDPASDLFAYFYELGTKIIKPINGLMGYISNTFDKTTAGKVLREYLSNLTCIREYVDFTEVQIFEGATTYPVIIVLKVKSPIDSQFKYTKIPTELQASVISISDVIPVEVLQNTLESTSWSFFPKQKALLYKRLTELPNIREIYGKCYYGVKTALNEAFIVNTSWSISDHVKYIYEGKEIKKWKTPNPEQKLILFESGWSKANFGNDVTEDQVKEKLKNHFPSLMSHLIVHEEKAKLRYDKGDFWWELRNCAYYELFEKPKIIFPNLQNSNKFSFDSDGIFVNAPAVFLPVSNKSLLCILNSKIVWEFLKSICVIRSGGYIEVKPQYFEQIPIPQITTANEPFLIKKADKIINLTKELQELSQKFQRTIQRKFNLEGLPGKLQNWYLLTYTEFITELAKKKVRLSLKEEGEWETYFLEEAKQALELKSEIDKTDQEIDRMVYELYGLTEEEIGIVEGKN